MPGAYARSRRRAHSDLAEAVCAELKASGWRFVLSVARYDPGNEIHCDACIPNSPGTRIPAMMHNGDVMRIERGSDQV